MVHQHNGNVTYISSLNVSSLTHLNSATTLISTLNVSGINFGAIDYQPSNIIFMKPIDVSSNGLLN